MKSGRRTVDERNGAVVVQVHNENQPSTTDSMQDNPVFVTSALPELKSASEAMCNDVCTPRIGAVLASRCGASGLHTWECRAVAGGRVSSP